MNVTHRRQVLGTILGGVSILFLILYFFGGESILGSIINSFKNTFGVGVLLISYFFWISAWRVFCLGEDEIELDSHEVILEVLAWVLFSITYLVFATKLNNGGIAGDFLYTSFVYVFGVAGTLWVNIILLTVSLIITFNVDIVKAGEFIKNSSKSLYKGSKQIIDNINVPRLEFKNEENVEQLSKDEEQNDDSKNNKKSKKKNNKKENEENDKKRDYSSELEDVTITGMTFDEKEKQNENEKEDKDKEKEKDKDKKRKNEKNDDKKENKEKKGILETLKEKIVDAEIIRDDEEEILEEETKDKDVKLNNSNDKIDEKEKIDEPKEDNIKKDKEVDEEEKYVEEMSEYEKMKEKYTGNSDSNSKEHNDSQNKNKSDNIPEIDEIEDDIDEIEEEEPVKERIPAVMPEIGLMDDRVVKQTVSQEELKDKADRLLRTLASFKIEAKVVNMTIGPSVTRFELKLAPGIKVSKLLGLQNDIGVTLATKNIRIEAPIPGKSAIGIEIPNTEPMLVPFREMVFQVKQNPHPLTIGLGKNINGEVVLFNIAKTPHLLIAGSTGSGKSVCVNTLICSILYNADPADVKFIMVDPKMVELSMYNGIPHLLIPVITEPKKAAAALNWAVEEMEQRYSMLADFKVKKIEEFNEKMERLAEENPKHKERYLDDKIPYIVVIIDELADLMVVARNEVEESIMRIAQKARAVGIHLVIATQRPSVNVITGVIKANLPSRISFAVQSQMDSRTILDQKGAEALIGKGDMLFWPIGKNSPERVQGAFVSNEECERLVKYWGEQMDVQYDEEINKSIESQAAGDSAGSGGASGEVDKSDELFPQAVKIVVEGGKASISLLQRKLSVGHARAARLMDIMEDAGIVSQMDQRNRREILITSEQIEEYI